MDPESRDLIESAYRTGPGYQQSAVDDHGYGDPGYSDPSYDGPKTPYTGSAFPGHPDAAPGAPAPRPLGGSGYRSAGAVPGYYVPEDRDTARRALPGPSSAPPSGGFAPPPGAPSGPDMRSATGARKALPGTGPACPEQWYDDPRLDDRAPGDVRRPVDPRLTGMNYGELRHGELRYDDPDPRSAGEPGYGEPLDDESWYSEFRRTPVHPQHPGIAGAAGADRRGPGPGGPRRRPEGPGSGPQPGYGFPPRPGRPAGHGPPRGPRMSAGRDVGPGAEPAAKGTGFLAAPVGLLTPPDGIRVDILPDADAVGETETGLLTAPDTAIRRSPRPAPRPGHGLDGPEITSSWPAQPEAGDLDSYEDFWRDDEDEEYTGLFGDRGAEFERADAKQARARQATTARRSIGRRRGRSNDHRLWLGLGGVVVVAAAAIIGIIKFEFPSHGGPAHTMVTPASIGGYTRTMGLERQTDVAELRDEVIKMSSGQASSVVSAVYQEGNSAAGNTEQIIMFIGGHLGNADPAASITSFTQKFPGAHVVSAGSLGGKAACVQEGAASNAVAMCAWFDNDSFGEIVSPTMNASALAQTMQTVRPRVELLAEK